MKAFSFCNSPFHNPTLPKLFTLILLSYIRLSVSEIINTHITDDSRALILFEQFGFNTNGHASINVQQLSWKSNNPNAQLHPPSLGFFLVRASSYPNLLNESEHVPSFCVLSSQHIKLVYRFNKLVITDKNASYTYNGSVIVEQPDKYILIFGNCQPDFKLSMKVRTEMYNMFDGAKDYLPVGQTTLPKLYLILFLIYSGFLALWAYICNQQRKNVDKIHLVMGVLLLLLTLKIICALEDKRYIRNTGTPHGWDVAFYIFSFFKGVTLFTVIILIGTGWSFLKPYLQEREKVVLMFVIPLQVLENIASVIIGETGPATKGWFRWNEIFLIIDVICCCTVIFPIAWSIRSLAEASKTDGKVAKNVEKLTIFKQFYIVVIVYLYFTRVVVSIIGAKVNYRYEWVAVAAAEGANLVFYSFIFLNFQPVDKNPYLVLHELEEDSAASAHMWEENISLG
ncbi:hypothetical protein AgCh_031847 [Apium graveolens]